MQQIDKSKFKGGLSVWCETEEQAMALMTAAERIGYNFPTLGDGDYGSRTYYFCSDMGVNVSAKHIAGKDAVHFSDLLLPETDNVNHPAHYMQGGIECIDAIKAAITGLEGMEAHCTGNAIKYLWRWKRKNGVEDINKAIWYLERLKKEVEETK